MGPVDVLTETEVSLPKGQVAAFAANPDNAPAWYENIRSVDWAPEPGLRIGARITFVAQFLARRMIYTYEIVEFIPGERLVMRTVEGPFPMETSYTWETTEGGGTRMTIRNRGEPEGFSRLLGPFMRMAMRRASTRDLARLKALLERGTQGHASPR